MWRRTWRTLEWTFWGLLLVVSLVGLLAPALSVCSLGLRGDDPRTVRKTVALLTSGRVASVVQISAGGAAGYVFDRVFLRRRETGRDVLVAHRLYGARVSWVSETELRIDHDAGEAGLTDCDGVTISYHLVRE